MGVLVSSFPSSLWAAVICKVLMTTATTMSGTVMAFAAFLDVNTSDQVAQVGASQMVAVGLAIISMPQIEKRVLSMGGAQAPHLVYTWCVFPAALLQLIVACFALPETHPRSKRIKLSQALRKLSSINPLAFMKVLAGKQYSSSLKKLMWPTPSNAV
jgi:hypothetical protein